MRRGMRKRVAKVWSVVSSAMPLCSHTDFSAQPLCGYTVMRYCVPTRKRTRGNQMNAAATTHHTNCLRCGRKLTSTKSTATGYGPKCAAHIRHSAADTTDY